MTGLKGTVVCEGKPVSGAYVRLLGPSGEFVNEQRTLEEGTFNFHLAPGTWTLDWMAPGHSSGEKTVVLTDGENAVVELQV